ncbi:H-2 class II histocompatibility antigen [Nibea albiflora]|uniref:H-2 class II histocompatibility antigen n=1 Tax=Nibea albiflora TaxID=240163 RepID=A0ACB7F6Q6_NIBAL|nr:H-2 class II histocompatibility antigen [Nibea albiflora]
MKICSSDMKRSALIILTLNSFCAFSQVPHEVTYFVGCFMNGTTEVQYEFDGDEILYVDFQKEEAVYTLPSQILADAPVSVFYPAEEVQLGIENTLTCFVNHFYPPDIKVSWTKNGQPLSEGVSLSRYYPNNDQTFHQFSTLTFTPREGDIYSCTVEHSSTGQADNKDSGVIISSH